MPEVTAVSVWPTCAVPVIVGWPVAGVLVMPAASVIWPVPTAPAMVAFVGFDRVTWKSSGDSVTPSSATTTTMVWVVSPPLNVNVPVAAV